jgi:hypothetical protein
MEIDLSTVTYPVGQYKNEYREKSKIIFDSITTLKNYNYMITSIYVYNIISNDLRFIDTVEYQVATLTVSNAELRKVGEICGYECYVDIYMDPFQILLSYDKSRIRDNKIDYILNNVEILKEKKVKIIS